MKRSGLKRGKPLRRSGFKSKPRPPRKACVLGDIDPERWGNRSWSNELRATPKEKTHREPKYLSWLRRQRCAGCCASPPSQASHHGAHGIAIKPPDSSCIPLCFSCHMLEWHRTGEVPATQGLSREERREWFREQATTHYSRYLEETR